MYKTWGKRILDFVVSLTGLVLLFPFLIILAVLSSLTHNGKPFFLQQRPGYREKIFTIVKFRTMREQKDENGQLRPDAHRTTHVGRFMRTYALDELPQLWNVLTGDMSLIGPRPLLPEYLALYNDLQRKRHAVLPGITGWAQIHGRNDVAWENKFALDIWYVENISFALDFQILIITLSKIWKRNLSNSSTAKFPEKFKG
jgi:undecaprenyl phosphate N,N'-diacetylbacillosamine 1-phosphate transferase